MNATVEHLGTLHRRARTKRPQFRRGVLGLVVGPMTLYGAVVFALGWNASNRLMYPSITQHLSGAGSVRGLPAKTVRVRGSTGAVLAGRFFPGRNRATIVLSHGYDDDQSAMLPWVAFLHRAGFSVFTYDMRGVGKSGGASTLGTLETRDLMSIVDSLALRPDIDSTRLGVLGFSLGGAVSLLAAARDRRIRAVVDDSGLADIREWVNSSVWRGLLHPGDPLSFASISIASLRVGVDIMSFHPVTEIARISPRPLLIIQGTSDSIVPTWEGRSNFAAAKEPKTFWLVRGAGHGEALQRDGSLYRARVVGFFRRAFHRSGAAHG